MKSVLFDGQPVIPSKVVCIGRNYVEHIEELGNEIPEQMVVFNKPNSAITDTLRYIDPTCRFEGEICFLIQRGTIAGIGFGLDLTRADIQNRLKEKGLPWERAKAFDGSAVLGDFVPVKGAFSSLRMTLHVDGKLQQHAGYGLMMYKPDTMLEEIKSFMTLEDGDVIMSGTPKGVGTFAAGQRFVGRVYSEGTLLIESSWTVGPQKSGAAK
ncbi:MAG: fumarylacetoacetate hydrolase family protein [Campylobacterales bacterium]|jgi:2-keto-4-pentenoate hydratase/2-oxohepta-3-ene-1,7-dioic acid hydratase in catechol pathway